MQIRFIVYIIICQDIPMFTSAKIQIINSETIINNYRFNVLSNKIVAHDLAVADFPLNLVLRLGIKR